MTQGRMLFSLGSIVATPGAMDLLNFDEIAIKNLLFRHAAGDWGDVDEEDKEANDEAVKLGNRIMSAYPILDKRLWIITEADRSATTLLLPEEY